VTDPRTPGQLIRQLLDEKGWTQRLLAVLLGVEETLVNKLTTDKRPVDAPMALMLSEVFSEPPERFLDLQKSLDLQLARIMVAPDPRRSTRARLFGNLPVAEMIKRRWLDDVEDIRETARVEAALAKFFHAPSFEEIELLPHAPKKTNVAETVTPPQLAWLYRVMQIAEDMLVPRYSPVAVEAAVSKLSNLLASAEEARKVPRILGEAGIRFVIVESLTSAKIDGVCFWLNDLSPVIGMSMRFDRIDNFWFVLRHELEHVLRRHGRDVAAVDAELEGERAGTGAGVPDEERVANEAASDFCVPRKKMEKFFNVKYPTFAERDILGFAKTLNIHPGLIAGQLQHRIGRYDRFRDHLVKIRSIVAPSAVVDGWGDVAPVGA
jgi:HTH-type transcriptional regulator/antitoxin HigA